ncbi:MFS transporter [Elioraea sp.]|uniref:MFS transporter n=1 Tax=Elioraea sp. TaxID=2185103 RepID=UPI003F706C79
MAVAPDRSQLPSVTAPAWRRIPSGIWALGFVSLLMDVSSEMIHALLPVYLVVGLGATALAVGIIEGIAEATAAITRIFSGALSDRIGRRKELAALGYGLAAFTKPIFPLAPRDALVADISPPELRGASFGLRQALDTVGAFLGPLLAIGLMALLADDFVSVFWVAVIPGFLAFGLIVFAVHEPARQAGGRQVRNPLSRAELAQLGPAYWWVVMVAAVCTLARFSEAFLILRAESTGLPLMLVPAVLVVMNIAYAASAYPVGALSDRVDRVGLLLIGLGLLIAADLVLAFAPGLVAIACGVVLWGLHMGFTQGLLAALVADAAPAELRGTGFGMFNLVTGLAMLAASVIAGALWDSIGPEWTFLAGAAFAAAAIAGLVPVRQRLDGRAARR